MAGLLSDNSSGLLGAPARASGLLGGAGPSVSQKTQSPFERNQQYVTPGQHVYNTPLPPSQEAAFRQWLAQNKVPFDPNAGITDYDMRGFYKALEAGDPRAASAIDPNDNRLHYPDYWKTPYHQTFSNESQWALPNAPHWNDRDQLVASDGRVIFDDRVQRGEQQ